EERILELHRIHVVVEERRGDAHVEARARVAVLHARDHVVRLGVDGFGDLDVAAATAATEHRAEGLRARALPAREAREPFPAVAEALVDGDAGLPAFDLERGRLARRERG